MQTVCPNREHRPPDMRCLSCYSSSSLFYRASVESSSNEDIIILSTTAEVDIAADAKGVFSPRTVLDWPTVRAVVDSEIAPLFDLSLGLSAWIYSLACRAYSSYQYSSYQGWSSFQVASFQLVH